MNPSFRFFAGGQPAEIVRQSVPGWLAWAILLAAVSRSPAQPPVDGGGAKLLTGTPRVPRIDSRAGFLGDVRITATIEGTERIRIYRDRAEWEHVASGPPSDVRINGRAWTPSQQPRIENAGPTAFLSGSAVLVGVDHWKIRGRGAVTLQVRPDHVLLEIADPQPGADAYDIIVHQGESFSDLTVSEANKERIATAFADAPETKHPSSRDVPTMKDFEDQRHKWKRSRLTAAYEKHGRRDPKWDDAARAFLDTETLLERELPPAEAMIATGLKVLALGCDDPLVCYVLGRQYSRSGKAAEAEKYVLHAVLGFETSTYPKRCTRAAPGLLARVYMMQSSDRSELAYALIRRSLNETAALLQEPLADEERRPLLTELRNGFAVGNLLEGQEPALLRMLADAGDCDPWIVHVLMADYQYKQAWEARGRGVAVTVSGDGWTSFHAYMGQVKAHSVAAWAAHPEHPEAAVRLIVSVRADGSVADETSRFWFDQALAAQIDAPQAHKDMLNCLRLGWGGTQEQILALGMECLRTGRFDTGAPAILVEAILGAHLEHGDLPAIVERGKYRDEILRGIQELERNAPQSAREEQRSRHLLATWALGMRDEAVRRWTESKGILHPAVVKEWKVDPAVVGYDLTHEPRPFQQAPRDDRTPSLFQGPLERPITDFAVAPSGEFVAHCARGRGTLFTVWDAASGQSTTIRVPSQVNLYQLSFSPDSKQLAVVQVDQHPSFDPAKGKGVVTLWKKGMAVTRDVKFPTPEMVYTVAWLPDSRHLAANVQTRVLIVDSQTDRIVAETDKFSSNGTAIAASPRGELVAAGLTDGVVRLYRIPTLDALAKVKTPARGELIGELRQHVRGVDVLVFSPDGRSLVSASYDDRSMWVWDVEARREKFRLEGYDAAFSPDGTKLATTGPPSLMQEVVIWDARTGAALKRCTASPGPSPAGNLQGVAFFGAEGEFVLAPSLVGTLYAWPVDDRK